MHVKTARFTNLSSCGGFWKVSRTRFSLCSRVFLAFFATCLTANASLLAPGHCNQSIPSLSAKACKFLVDSLKQGLLVVSLLLTVGSSLLRADFYLQLFLGACLITARVFYTVPFRQGFFLLRSKLFSLQWESASELFRTPEIDGRNKSICAKETPAVSKNSFDLGDLASRGLASQAKQQREPESQACILHRSILKHADFSQRKPTSQDFRDAIWGCAIPITSHIAVASVLMTF